MLEKTSIISFKSTCSPKQLQVAFAKSMAVDTFVKTGNAVSLPPCLLISFTGLTRAIGRKLFNRSEEINDLNNRYPKADGVVGSLPSEWIDKIPEEKRKEQIDEVYSSFAAATNILRKSLYQIDKRIAIESASNAIKVALLAAEIIDQKDIFHLTPLKSGQYGTGYSFIIEDKKYLLKVFHKSNTNNELYHGPCIETNRAEFIDQNAPNSQYAEFYFGDIKDAYDVFKFIDSTHPKPKRTVDEKGLGFRYGDNGEEKAGLNIINNYIVDYGGFSIKSQVLAENKTARWVYKKMVNKTPVEKQHENWDKLYRLAIANHVPNRQDILIGLAACLEYLPHEYKLERLIRLAETNNIGDNTRVALLNYVAEDENISTDNKFHIYKALLTDSGKEARKQFINNMDSLDKKDQITAFKLLAAKADDEIKLLLANHILNLPSEYQAESIKELSTGSNQQLKEALFNCTLNLRDPVEYLEVLKPILDGADDKVKSLIADRAGISGNIEVFKLVAKVLNDEQKASLAYQIRYFSGDLALEAFITLARGASKELKEVLKEKVRYLNEQYKKQALKMIEQ